MSTRDRVFDAARALFDAEGVEGLSMRKVAAAVGLTPMALYRHFADKDALVDALTEDGLAAWDRRLAAALVGDAEPMWMVETGLNAFIDFALDEPRRFEAAFILPARSARKFPEDFAQRRSAPVNRLLDAIEAARGKGLAADASALEVMMTVWGLGQGLISLYRAGRFSSEAGFRDFAARAIKRCLTSFATPEPTP
ncbi:MAG: TetR/AcrR family transcriptional regulator [Proteobacteria bacterium]|nr:TetR/AcrR family transcriptional regulator [Pseudomonadota bacterium]